MTTPATNRQVPDNSIFDNFNKQIYLGNQFIYTLQTTVATTAETPILLYTNPLSNNQLPSTNKALFQNIRRASCLTAAATAIFKFYAQPTITTNGTPITPLNLRPLNANTSVAAIYSAPTVSANGTFVSLIATAAFNPTLSQTLQVADPGVSILVTCTVSTTSVAVATEFSWYEI